MIQLTSIEPLFREDAAVPRQTMLDKVLEDFKMTRLAGVPDTKIQISFNPEEGSDIIVKAIDPHASSGYLVFKDEQAYNQWLDVQLYEPSQDEIQEAVNGSRST